MPPLSDDMRHLLTLHALERAGTAVDPLDAIRELLDVQVGVSGLMHEAVRQAREDEHTWGLIAAALGVTRQAAWQRFGDLA